MPIVGATIEDTSVVMRYRDLRSGLDFFPSRNRVVRGSKHRQPVPRRGRYF